MRGIIKIYYIFTSNTVCSLISVHKASKATPTLWYRKAHCSSLVVAGSPNGYGIDIAGTILLAPTLFATGIKLAICTIVIPAFSISFVIVAPQRVQVPQVETNKATFIPASVSSSAISLPIRAASA